MVDRSQNFHLDSPVAFIIFTFTSSYVLIVLAKRDTTTRVTLAFVYIARAPRIFTFSDSIACLQRNCSHRCQGLGQTDGRRPHRRGRGRH